MQMRVPWWIPMAAAALVLVLTALGWLTLRTPVNQSDPTVPFMAGSDTGRAREKRKVFDRGADWPIFGRTRARTHFLADTVDLRPPFKRRWKFNAQEILTEFPPAVAGGSLYLLKNNAALYALSKRAGRVRWKRKLGDLAASSPAVADGTVYVTLLQRGKTVKAGRVMALDAKDGRTRWSRRLASRSESSPLVHRGRLYFGTEGGKLIALRTRDGSQVWSRKLPGKIKAAPAMADGKLYVGTYGGTMVAVRARDGKKVWSRATSGGTFGLGSGNFYSSPAAAYGRVYAGSTDGRVYSFSSADGRIAWTRETGGYVYASPAVAQVGSAPPTVYIGSYSGTFYALNARTGKVRWQRKGQGKISGSAAVIGTLVYYSNLDKRVTLGLDARTGRERWRFSRGGFSPAVSDGRRLYITGYSAQYAFEPAPR